MTHKELNELSYMKLFIKELTDHTKYTEFFTQCVQAILTALSYLIDGVIAIGYAVFLLTLGLIVSNLILIVILLTPVWLLCDCISVWYSKCKADMEAD